ncbi:MAG: cytochrome P460 family protein [Nitrospiraceae bacterium]
MNRYALWSVAAIGGLLVGCAECGSGRHGAGAQPVPVSAAAATAAVPKDGELRYPTDYKNWASFLQDVQRPDVKQVRDIYINQAGTRVTDGQPFAVGSVMVMELYKAKMDGDAPVTTADGKLVKGDLAKVFVMEKGPSTWGQDVPDNLKNGTWVFSAYGPDGKPLAEDFTKCRACHTPVASKDFTHRFDEYLQQRRTRG